MRHLKAYEAGKTLDLSNPTATDMEKLAIAAIETYIKSIFFDKCKQFAYVTNSIDLTNIYFYIDSRRSRKI